MPRYFYIFNETTYDMDLKLAYVSFKDPFSKIRISFCILFFIISFASLYFGKRSYDIRKKPTFFTVIAIIDSISSALKVLVLGTEFIKPTSFIQIGISSFIFNFNYILVHISVSALVFYWIHKYHDHIKKQSKSWSSMFICVIFLMFNTFGILVCFVYAYCEANRLCDSQFYRSTTYIVNIIYFLADVCYAGSLFVYGFLIGKNHKKSMGILVCSIALGVTFLYNAVELFTTAFISSLNEVQSMLFDITDLLNIIIIYLCVIGIVHFDTEVKVRYLKKLEVPNPDKEENISNSHYIQNINKITNGDFNYNNNNNNINNNNNNNLHRHQNHTGGAGGISPISIFNNGNNNNINNNNNNNGKTAI
ncbi:hypothetical protein DDB_G0272923 [Dictyostelium discoideum AX4]|uniref:THH1/TOM1/TOM3 domain-containing protein n=1 Tax=Dictyostelium discoideum TaxID=44689 RepID=Q559B0_DICDI|nr:hypothetical protein DDB_G0272923 [Dictyostelium discoideum AX4]EAL71099.1 hypothetical protein DDB_G0272923 [Dictyostelium discoideum AX4]|eukprot:XP_644906.1 hypothetical protein DDB_G0272923 [Dictyostelium discoideum AX4]